MAAVAAIFTSKSYSFPFPKARAWKNLPLKVPLARGRGFISNLGGGSRQIYAFILPKPPDFRGSARG